MVRSERGCIEKSFPKVYNIGILLEMIINFMNKSGETIISVKGRDYFDLMWYLQKGVVPNLNCIEDVDNLKGLKNKLLKIIDKIDSRSITLDLENFIEDRTFVKNLGNNIKEILKNEVSEMK